MNLNYYSCVIICTQIIISNNLFIYVKQSPGMLHQEELSNRTVAQNVVSSFSILQVWTDILELTAIIKIIFVIYVTNYFHHSSLWRNQQKIHNPARIRTPRSIIDESNQLNNPCVICKKKFRNWKSLKVHMSAFHPGNRQPTNCEVCGKILSCRFIAMAHQRRYHLSNPYACKLCGKTYALRYQFNWHLQKALRSDVPRSSH